MQETQKRYPTASIVDYLHVGRTVITPDLSQEMFKLWLRQRDGREFGVYVTILFNSYTDEIQSIRFVETDR
jgi:hypothetical protein